MWRRGVQRAPHYVYELPYGNRLQLCKILDGGGWDTLAGEVGIDADDIILWQNELRNGNSAAEKVLQSWSHLNPTIVHLFQHLYNLRQIRAMHCIKEYVPAQWRRDLLQEDDAPEPVAANQRPVANGVVPRVEIANGAPRFMRQESDPDNNRKFINRPVSEHELPPPMFDEQEVPKMGGYANFNRDDFKTDKWQNKNKANDMQNYYTPVNRNNNILDKSITKECDYCSPEEHKQAMNHQLPQRRSQGPVEMDEPVKTQNRVDLPSIGVQKENNRRAMESEQPRRNLEPRKGESGSMNMNFESNISNGGNLQDTAARDDSNTENVVTGSNVMRFSPVQIKQATGCYDSRSVIGEGAYGKVYVAEMHGQKFAVKVINESKLAKDKPTEHHIKEKLTLDKYRHPNIVQLCGYCFDGDSPCLVFEYMENGNLAHRIACKGSSPPLSWQIRHSIACDVASALNYLHNGAERPTIHGDIKSPNILLNLHWVAKLSDFGLAQQATSGTVSGQYTQATIAEFGGKMEYGSYEYIPEEVWESQGHVSTKTDVFSLGVVMLELLTGQRPRTPERKPDLLRTYIQNLSKDWSALEKLRDPLAADWPRDTWNSFMRLALRCTSRTKKKRPEMKELSKELAEMKKQIEEMGLAQWPVSRPINLSEIPMNKNLGDVCWQNSQVKHPSMNRTPDVASRFQQMSLIAGTPGQSLSEPSPLPNTGRNSSHPQPQQNTSSTGDYEGRCGAFGPDHSYENLTYDHLNIRPQPYLGPPSHIPHKPEAVPQPIPRPKLMQLFYEILNEDKAGKTPRETQVKAQNALLILPKSLEDGPMCSDLQHLVDKVKLIAYPLMGTEVRDNVQNEQNDQGEFDSKDIPLPILPPFEEEPHVPVNPAYWPDAPVLPKGNDAYKYNLPNRYYPYQPASMRQPKIPPHDELKPDNPTHREPEFSNTGSSDGSKRSSGISDDLEPYKASRGPDPCPSMPDGSDEISHTQSMERKEMELKRQRKTAAIFD